MKLSTLVAAIVVAVVGGVILIAGLEETASRKQWDKWAEEHQCVLLSEDLSLERGIQPLQPRTKTYYCDTGFVDR